MNTQYDAIIIGAGQAGPFLAARLCSAGRRVALVEKEHVGGTCVNVGCTPTKAMVASARGVQQARRGVRNSVSRLQSNPQSRWIKFALARTRLLQIPENGLTSWLSSLNGSHARTGSCRLPLSHVRAGWRRRSRGSADLP